MLGHFAFALIHEYGDSGLVVGCGRKDLALLARNGRIPFDEFGHDTAERFDTEAERGHVEEQQIFHRLIAAQHAALYGGAHGHHFIGIHALVGYLAEEIFDGLLHERLAGRSAHQNDFVDVLYGEFRIGQRLAARLDGALDKGHHE